MRRFLGLNDLCLTCHEDYHQKTLSVNCLNCHVADAFKPASKFNHTKAKYQLRGKHAEVTCVKCHTINERNGKSFQQFTGLQFQNCVIVTKIRTKTNSAKIAPSVMWKPLSRLLRVLVSLTTAKQDFYWKDDMAR